MKVKSKKKSRRIHDQQLIINVLSISLARSPKKKNGPRWGPGTPPPISFFSGPVFSLIFAPFIFFSLSLSLSIFFFFRSSTHNSKRNRSERKKKRQKEKKENEPKILFSLSLFFFEFLFLLGFSRSVPEWPHAVWENQTRSSNLLLLLFFSSVLFFFPFLLFVSFLRVRVGSSLCRVFLGSTAS